MAINDPFTPERKAQVEAGLESVKLAKALINRAKLAGLPMEEKETEANETEAKLRQVLRAWPTGGQSVP